MWVMVLQPRQIRGIFLNFYECTSLTFAAVQKMTMHLVSSAKAPVTTTGKQTVRLLHRRGRADIQDGTQRPAGWNQSKVNGWKDNEKLMLLIILSGMNLSINSKAEVQLVIITHQYKRPIKGESPHRIHTDSLWRYHIVGMRNQWVY